MKRFVVSLCAALLVMGLASCGKTGGEQMVSQAGRVSSQFDEQRQNSASDYAASSAVDKVSSAKTASITAEETEVTGNEVFEKAEKPSSAPASSAAKEQPDETEEKPASSQSGTSKPPKTDYNDDSVWGPVAR